MLEQAHRASRRWRTTSFLERAARVRALAQVLRSDNARLSGVITTEMGKPIVESEAEIEKYAWNCDFLPSTPNAF